MPKFSAALLVYRQSAAEPEFLIVHPGGPFYAKKDQGVWSVPKGEYLDGDDAYACALREFEEEIGQPAPVGEVIDLGTVTQKTGKRVCCWAVEGELDVSVVTSNEFEMEWPPKSGRMQSFPEVDRAEWVTADVARTKLNPAQVDFVDRLLEILNTR